MCDTLAARGPATQSGVTLFGKNSDRERREAQQAQIAPRAEHPPGATVQCTYVRIPQARTTYAVLLCRPFWMWGAEMGANEFGVAIGNEAVHARSGPPMETALLGMDLVRLGLERARTAREAIEVLTTLLEIHGQGGDCGLLQPIHYHNSFMIADPTACFVLETLGRDWMVEEVVGARAISNAYTIDDQSWTSAAFPARIAPDVAASGLTLSRAIADPQVCQNGWDRCARATTLLEARHGVLRQIDVFRILRDHGAAATIDWRPARSNPPSICAHATDHRPRGGQTVGSLVSQLHETGPQIHWITGTAAPCISVFKPAVIGLALPDLGPAPTGYFDDACYWWRHERLHWALLDDPALDLVTLRTDRDRLEAQMAEWVEAARTAGPAELQQAVERCWRAAETLEAQWLAPLADASSPAERERR